MSATEQPSPCPLLCVAIIGMGCIAVLAGLSEALQLRYPALWIQPPAVCLANLVLVGGFGCVFGILSVPVVHVALRRKKLVSVIDHVYGPTAAVVMIWAYFTNSPVAPCDDAMVALTTVCAAAMLLRRQIPDRLTPMDRCCPACGYDLQGKHARGCPECGWNRR